LHRAPLIEVITPFAQFPIDMGAGVRDFPGCDRSGPLRAVKAQHIPGSYGVIAVSPEVAGGDNVSVAGRAA